MRPYFPLFLAASKAILKPGDPLKWKKRLVKDVRLLLQLTEAMKIVRLTSLLADMPRLSSPRPRLRDGRRLSHPSRLNLTLNLCSLSFVLSLALLLRFPSLLSSQLFLSQRVGFSHCRLPEIPLFCFLAKGFL